MQFHSIHSNEKRKLKHGVATSTSIDIENISYDNAGTAAKGSLTVAIAANETASAGSAGAAAAPIADAATRAMVAAE